MKFFAATLLAVSAAAVKIQQEAAELEGPKCPDEPTDISPADLFDLVDQDGSGDIDGDEAADALFCAGEWGWIKEEDKDEAIASFNNIAGSDGKIDGEEAKKAYEEATKKMPKKPSGDELAQEEGRKKGPKPDGSGSDSGSDSGPDLDDLPSDLPSDIDSEDVDEILDEVLAQKSGPPKGEGSYELPSGIDSSDLEDLAQKSGPPPKGEGSYELPSGIDSEDLEEVLAQKSGPPKGEGSYELPSGIDTDDLEDLAQKSGPPKGEGSYELPSDFDSEDLEELAQEEGKGPKCPKAEDMEGLTQGQIFDLVDQDESGDIDEAEGEWALDCAKGAGLLSDEDADLVADYIKGKAGEDKKLSRDEADKAWEEVEAME